MGASFKLTLLAACIAAANHAIAAGADDIVCPATILASTAVTTAEGWEPQGGAAEYRLDQAQLYMGNPADDRPLPPESGAGEDPRWRLPDSKAGDVWVGCTYSNTTVVLARKLDPRLTQCMVKRETVERQGKGADSHAVEATPAITCN
ncbi:STY0301 family protein [Pseudoduganella ginsengisoli]|uniref:DUF3757 domain-containing protein n=1 Tax=Pseudoduganella ginsengisoli TaxID=1462440 RepID=A0A6L6Q4P1_9BURK|nr:STY0301 family protein [Pseudoduganella ginsengisoli]MTW04680.1 hypothetical protein [Pseudoduganella ginsengisoli]